MRNWVAATVLVAMSATAALADSCWTHNGSMMRLQAQGAERWFTYDSPRQALWASGVAPGTLLFDGRKSGDWYAGNARVFSSACPGTPLLYFVEGPVLQNPLRVVLTGTREVHQNCQPTGRVTTDELVFTYSHQC